MWGFITNSCSLKNIDVKNDKISENYKKLPHFSIKQKIILLSNLNI